MRKNLWELLDALDLHIFKISIKFCFFWYPLRLIPKKFFSTLIRDGAIFLKVKRSNKIETVQYLKKKPLFCLRISWPKHNRMKQSDLGKSLDPTPQHYPSPPPPLMAPEDAHSETGGPARQPAQVARRWGHIKWNSGRWGKKYLYWADQCSQGRIKVSCTP
jgi:hypothetical protein